MRILVVEDELHLSEALSHILKKNNYTVDVANDGETGLDNALSGIYDVIVLDIMLPKMDGITVLKTLRSEGFDTPVILLTAKNEISDKVLGLDSGADDYLAKPFNTEELLARIRALGRRRGEIVSNTNTIEKLWGFDSEAESNHVEVYISFLRKKLAFVHSKVSINTVRGVGYTLSE